MKGKKSLAQRSFSAKLMTEILSESRLENTVCSPMGISYVLKALQMGMKPGSEYFNKIETLVGGEQSDDDKLVGSDVAVKHALSCWHDQNAGTLNDEYVKGLNRLCEASAYNVDFSKDNTIKQMNTWISKNTHGLIRKVGCEVNPYTALILIDALYMYAEWFKKFDKQLTTRDVFHNADGSESEVDMMYSYLPLYHYCETRTFKTIHLAYYNCVEDMKIVIPKGNTSLHDLMTNKFDTWTHAKTNMANVDFYMPRFKFKSNFELTTLIKRMGLAEMFTDPDIFSNMASMPTIVSGIHQQCTIDVDEKGTRATSLVNGCKKFGRAPRVKTYAMKLDKPFGFAIMDFEGEVLFTGVVNTLPSLA